MKKIVVKALLIATLIAAVSATLIVTTILANSRGLSDATVINVAGKQRMLSQRTLKESGHQLAGLDRDLAHLRGAIEEFEANLGDLMEGNRARHIYAPPNEAVEAALKKAVKNWQALHQTIAPLLQGANHLASPIDQQRLIAQGETLLLSLEEAVEAYTVHSEASRVWLQRLQYLFAVILLVAVSYSLYLIWGIRAHVRDFINQSQQLAQADLAGQDGPIQMALGKGMEQELQEAGGYINDFVVKVERLLTQSSQLQTLSGQMADELGRMSDEISTNLTHLQSSEAKSHLGQSEVIAIESSEELLRTVRLLENLQSSLDRLRKSAIGA